MEVKLAKNYGFCFGVKRAIELAEKKPNGITLGPLIHNDKEINRLKEKFNVVVNENIQEIPKNAEVIIRTHGIPKQDLQKLKEKLIISLMQLVLMLQSHKRFARI